MATKAEAIRLTAPALKQSRNHGRTLVQGFRRWAQKGQLGSSAYLEAGRYSGGRV